MTIVLLSWASTGLGIAAKVDTSRKSVKTRRIFFLDKFYFHPLGVHPRMGWMLLHRFSFKGLLLAKKGLLI
jgi:hypothetical protein